MTTGSASDVAVPARLVGVPLRSLAFGLRNWLAMVLALYVAFWLQLESASSAAVCVGILALPTRGQVLQKALYRFAATVIGVIASFVIAGLFNEIRELFIAAFALWLGLCVFAAEFLDGNRAYGAVLSGYTVAVVAVAQIDAPQTVFSAGVNRGAAIVIGILAIAFVNDVFAAPDVFPDLMGKIEALRHQVRQYVTARLRGVEADPAEAVGLYARITALHPDITALPAERLTGRDRAAAARIAVTAMVEQILAARAVAVLLDASKPDAAALRSELIEALDEADQESVRPAPGWLTAGPETHRLAAATGLEFLSLAKTEASAIRRLRAGTAGPAGPRLPVYRSAREAARNGVRTFIAVLAAAAALQLTGWPSVSLGLALIGATLGIGATNPKPANFAMGALMAMPLAALVAGVTEYLVLDGSDDFPMLALALAPPVMAASVMLGTGKPKLVGLGFLILVFFPVLLSPSNPQSYDPESYLDTSVIAVTAVIGLFILLSTLLPTTDAMRRAWILRSAEADGRDGFEARGGNSPASTIYRDATRIGLLGTLVSADGAGGDELRRAMRLMERSAARQMGMAGYPLIAVALAGTCRADGGEADDERGV